MEEGKKDHKSIIYIVIIVCLLLFIGYKYLPKDFFKKSINEEKTINVEKLKNNVVYIMNYNSTGELKGVGSGVYINSNTIYTNYHVIEGASIIDVALNDNSKVRVLGIKASDKTKDIAIIITEPVSNIETIEFNNEIKSGDKVYAIGNPLGIKNVVSDGIYSGEYTATEGIVYQHTAPISSGNSGGALFNDKGELVGINYASFTVGQNLNLAIKIEDFNKVYNDNINNALTPVKTSYFYDSKIAKNANKLFSEVCKLDVTCDGAGIDDFEFVNSDEYKAINNIEYGSYITVESNYKKESENTYDNWLRVFVFKIKKEDDEMYSLFKDFVKYKVLETRDSNPGLSIDIYYSKNKDYYYYVEYKNRDISGIVTALEEMKGE